MNRKERRAQRKLSGGALAKSPAREQTLKSKQSWLKARGPRPHGSTIGVSMIVKDEAHVIIRCLESVRPIADYVLVQDTGSSDGTPEVIRAWLKETGMPGTVSEHPWRDFAANRTLALSELKALADVDYLFIIDADDRLVLPPDYRKPVLDADSYLLEVHHGAMRHWRPHLLRSDLNWRYEGVIHEFLSIPTADGAGRILPEHIDQRRLTGPYIAIGFDGARRATTSESERFSRDAEVITRALQDNPDPFLVSRYTFYLAQSLHNSGRPELALESYRARAEMGFWVQEAYIARYRVAKIMADLVGSGAYSLDQVLEEFEAAHTALPSRAEPLHAASVLCRQAGRFEEGLAYARRGLAVPIPSDALFLDKWVYDYGLLDEFGVNAYWADRFEDCATACRKMLQKSDVPYDVRLRVSQNLEVAERKLQNGGQSRDAFSVFLVQPPDYLHWQAYREIAETVLYGLRECGLEAQIQTRTDRLTDQVIVIGGHVISSEAARQLPARSIIYNCEHHNSSWITGETPQYLSLLQTYPVWDYSHQNAVSLSGLLGKDVRYVMLGYTPDLTRIEPALDQDIDVLFYGSINARRQDVLDRLRAEGLKVHQAFGVYGKERDDLIARSKLVLNVHYYEPGVFEIVRVSFLLANRKAVVSEASHDEAIEPDLAHAVHQCAYADLVASCKALVDDADRRRRLEEDGFKAFAARDEAQIIRSALEATRLQWSVQNG